MQIGLRSIICQTIMIIINDVLETSNAVIEFEAQITSNIVKLI